MVGDRETAIMLEKWGYLPIDQAALDKRIQDWYVSQGLAMRGDNSDTAPPRREDTPQDTPVDTPERVVRPDAALEAAEAALQAAHAALKLARSLSAS
jgi:hypothetical protein